MKNFLSRFSKKQIVLSIIAIISLLLFAGLTFLSTYLKNDLLDQQEAKRWAPEGGAAQLSCYFTEDTEVDEFQMISFTKELEKALSEAGIENENENARMYADAYSSQGKITIASTKTSVETNAIGIGGDFFLFHPVQLLSGSYFSGNDLMQDFVVIDENLAWQLFGSSDIAGQSVIIDKVPHYVAAVIKNETGKYQEAAGLTGTIAYVSHETLKAHGTTTGIDTYELVAPNPMKGFAYGVLKEKFGLDETKMTVVENSKRYSLESLLIVILDFGKRSMQNHAIHLPYWENIARAYEDVLALLLVFQTLFLLIPIVFVCIWVVYAWKHRTWNMRSVGKSIVVFKDNFVEKCREEKHKWKHF